MVVLNIKRGEQPQFLYETTMSSKVENVLTEICSLINGKLKILRITDSMVSLALENSGKFWKLEIDDISGGILLNLVILMLDFVELMTNHVE